MNLDLKKAKVVYKNDLGEAKKFAEKIAQKLSCELFSIDNLPNRASLIIVVGGDGTLLKCARHASRFDIPVFGFNMGRLGFLAQANLNEMDDVLEQLEKGNFRIEERIMLQEQNGSIALNDIVVKNLDCSRTSNLALLINDKLVCSYLADGVIVSTPTGSTAYNLSAGGAVISPDIECFTIVPICAHTLSSRPIVVPSNSKIEIKFKAKNADFQTISDGQLTSIKKESIVIKKCDKKAKLLLLNKENKDFYDVLRDKLHWGVAPFAW